MIIAGSSDTMVWMWKAVTGKCMRVFAGHLGPVLIGDWAIDGKLAVTGSEDGSAFVWSPKTGESVAHFKGKEYHDAPITALATATANTKNQNLILTGSADRDIIVARVGETDNQCKVLRKLRGHTDGVEGVCFASKLNYCASASLDASVAIWDLGTGQQRSRFKHDEGAVFCSFLDQFTAPGLKTTVHGPPDHLLLSCSLDQTVRLWDARSGKAVKTFRGHKNNVHRFSCSNDGKFVATACDDGASLVFEL